MTPKDRISEYLPYIIYAYSYISSLDHFIRCNTSLFQSCSNWRKEKHVHVFVFSKFCIVATCKLTKNLLFWKKNHIYKYIYIYIARYSTQNHPKTECIALKNHNVITCAAIFPNSVFFNAEMNFLSERDLFIVLFHKIWPSICKYLAICTFPELNTFMYIYLIVNFVFQKSWFFVIIGLI